jgi:hypothetical protein
MGALREGFGMGTVDNIVQALGQGSEIVRARVTGLEPTLRLLVRRDGDDTAAEWRCDVLLTGTEAPSFDAGDEVLVLLRRDGRSDGIVLGRVGRAAVPGEAPEVTPRSAPAPADGTTEKRVVIEADEELILRVGESSIRISRNGKVVIRGQHVLTRAKGTNRIKGGSVAIN